MQDCRESVGRQRMIGVGPVEQAAVQAATKGAITFVRSVIRSDRRVDVAIDGQIPDDYFDTVTRALGAVEEGYATLVVSYLHTPALQARFQECVTLQMYGELDLIPTVTHRVVRDLLTDLPDETLGSPQVFRPIAETIVAELSRFAATYIENLRRGDIRSFPRELFESVLADPPYLLKQRLASLRSKTPQSEFSEIHASETRLQLAAASKVRHRRLRVHGSRRLGDALFDDLYVDSPRLSSRKHGRLAVADVLRLVRDSNYAVHLALVGPAGIGKSTALTFVVRGLAQQDFQTKAAVVLQSKDLRGGASDFNLLDRFARRARVDAEISTNIAEVLQYWAESGELVAIFDGFDEELDDDSRRRNAESIRVFCDRYPDVCTIIASRPEAYRSSALGEDLFDELRVESFGSTEITEYGRRYFSLYRPSWSLAIQRSEATQFSEHIGQHVADVGEVPLLLSLAASLWNTSASFPQTRTKLLSACIDLLFHDWEKGKGTATIELRGSFFATLCGRLAWELADREGDQQSSTDGLRDSDIHRIAMEYLAASVYGIGPSAEREARVFLQAATGRIGLLRDVGSDFSEQHYDFSHRTFWEYYVGFHLANMDSVSAERILIAGIGRSLSIEILSLSLELLEDSDPRRSQELFQRLVRGFADQSGGDKPHQKWPEYLTYTLKSITPGPDGIRSLVSELGRMDLSRGVADELAGLNFNNVPPVVTALLEEASQRPSFVNTAIVYIGAIERGLRNRALVTPGARRITTISSMDQTGLAVLGLDRAGIAQLDAHSHRDPLVRGSEFYLRALAGWPIALSARRLYIDAGADLFGDSPAKLYLRLFRRSALIDGMPDAQLESINAHISDQCRRQVRRADLVRGGAGQTYQRLMPYSHFNGNWKLSDLVRDLGGVLDESDVQAPQHDALLAILLLLTAYIEYSLGPAGRAPSNDLALQQLGAMFGVGDELALLQQARKTRTGDALHLYDGELSEALRGWGAGAWSWFESGL
ncbi:MAG: NACHT domain-containing protein [Actinomycetota bacterium]